MRNNKGYVLVEIVLAFAITFTLIYFIMDLVISMKSKNDDIMVETLVKTDQAIITNKLMSYAIEEKENFDCNDLKSNITDKVVKYDGNTMDIVNDYSYIDRDNVSCKIEFGKINIVIPIEVRQMKDKNYDVVIDYKYDIGAQIPPTCSLSVDASGVISATYADDHENSSGINYYGWSSSLSGVTSSETDIIGEETYTFYVTDRAENLTTCSITTDYTNATCPSGYALSGSSCVKTTTPNIYTAYSGTCECQYYDGGSSYNHKSYSCNYTSGCGCPSGYNKIIIDCNSYPVSDCGGGSLSGGTCYHYSNINYTCNSGYTKINDSYCYK